MPRPPGEPRASRPITERIALSLIVGPSTQAETVLVKFRFIRGATETLQLPIAVAATLLDDRDDHLAFLVDDRELGAEEVGAAHIAAAEIGAVASGATDAVDRLAALDLFGILGLALLAGDKAPDVAALRRHDRAKCER